MSNKSLFCTEDWSCANRGGENAERGEGMEPRFISWNAAALYTFEFTFPDIWSRKRLKLYHRGSQRCLQITGTMCIRQPTASLD